MMQGQSAYYRPMNRTSKVSADSRRMHISMNDGGREADWYGKGASVIMGLNASAKLKQPHTDRYAASQVVPLVSGKGVRNTLGHVIIAMVCFVLGVMTIMNLVDLKAAGDRVNYVRVDIQETIRTNGEKEQELAAKAREVNVGYEAAKLGMVSAKSVEAIYLTLPQTVRTLQADVNAVPGDHLAALLGN